MKLTEKSARVYNYTKENGGRVAIPDAMEDLALTIRQITPNINDLVKKGLAVREAVELPAASEDEKPTVVKYIQLTEEGMNFVPSDDEE